MTWLPLVSATFALLGIIANVALVLFLRAALRRVEAVERAAESIAPGYAAPLEPADAPHRMLATALFVKRLYSGVPVDQEGHSTDDLAAPPAPFEDPTGVEIWREAIDRAFASGWKPVSFNDLNQRLAVLEERAATSDRWVAEGPARRKREFDEAMEAIRVEGESRASAARAKEAEERSPS